jgi:hypothetical protein
MILRNLNLRYVWKLPYKLQLSWSFGNLEEDFYAPVSPRLKSRNCTLSRNSRESVWGAHTLSRKLRKSVKLRESVG